jgi:hypothetical protein
VSEYYGPVPVPVTVSREKMLETVSKRYGEYSDIYEKLLPKDILNHLGAYLGGKQYLDAERWSEIVWRMFEEYSETNDVRLVDALRVMWLTRFIGFYNECKDMDFCEAEARIRENAIIFEEIKGEILGEAS